MNTTSAWIGIALCGTVVIGLSDWAFRARPEVDVESAQVTSGAITRRILATGTVQPTSTVDVGTQVSGTVQSLGADFNSIVHTGDVIARLDPSLYQAALDQARASLREAEAAFIRAQADLAGLRTAAVDAGQKFDRAKRLWTGGIMTNADYDAAQIAMNEASADVVSGQARLNQAQASVDQAKAVVDQATVDLEHTVIHSPIDGIVVSRNVDVGQTVAATISAPVLFQIATDFGHVQVQVAVDQADIGGLATGEPVTFEVESYPNEKFHGTVQQLRLQPVSEQTTTATGSTGPPASSVVGTVVSYTAVIDVSNPEAKLRPGMTAEVALEGLRRESAIRIPNSALSFRPPHDVLQALGEAEPSIPTDVTLPDGSTAKSSDVWEYDGKRFTPIAVRVGLADDHWTELVGGSLRPGDTLVTSAVVRQRRRL
jgi:HlyD family secretion protein